VVITLTPEEKAQLETENTLIRELPGANGANRADYHNPVTGQEMSGPIDPYHMTRRLRQGWQLGPAPTELKSKWLIREQELKEEDDHRQKEYEDSDEHKVDLSAQEDRFNDAVAAAVTQVLEKLGVELPNEGQTTLRQKEEEAPSEVEHQADFLQTIDDRPKAPSTVGSAASRPELKLVE